MKKTLKITAIIIISLLVLVLVAVGVCCYVHSLPKTDEEETQQFLEFKEYAEAVNGYIIENFGHKANTDDNSILVSQEGGKVVGLYDAEAVEIPEWMIASLDNIKNGMHQSDTDFFIDITEDRISYGGASSYMYVYSRNGKAPTYFYHDGDGMHPEVYNLCDNWYLLKVNFI